MDFVKGPSKNSLCDHGSEKYLRHHTRVQIFMNDIIKCSIKHKDAREKELMCRAEAAKVFAASTKTTSDPLSG